MKTKIKNRKPAKQLGTSFEKCFGLREIRRKNNPATAQASVQGGRKNDNGLSESKTLPKTFSMTNATDLVWVDVAYTPMPSAARAYGFMSPDLVPVINELLNGVAHSLVMGGVCFESFSEAEQQKQLRRTTKWEEVSK